MKYAKIEKDTNKLLGFSPDKEDGLIEITDDVWQEALKIEYSFCYYIDGKFVYKDTRTDEEIELQYCNKKITDADEYLRSTGWLVERFNDPSSGKDIPSEVLVKRVEARELINTIKIRIKDIQGLA